MTIKHFEDLAHNQIQSFLDNPSRFSATEKVDGSQLLFGIDQYGFYTSRETKGGKRVYSVDEYDTSFANTYRRLAHLALYNSVDLLVAAGMKVGDQVEIEVLYGRIPNVIKYSELTNFIIFLRKTQGNIDLESVNNSFNGHTLSITTEIPEIDDNLNTLIKEKTVNFSFARVPVWQFDKGTIFDTLAQDHRDFLESVSTYHTSLTFNDALSINLTKIKGYNLSKDELSIARDNARILYKKFLGTIKEQLLNHLVRNRASLLGADWIEGVVFSSQDFTFKLVDKESFRVAQEFYWLERNKIRDLTGSELRESFDKYTNNWQSYSIKVNALGKTLTYEDPVHKRTLEAYALQKMSDYENR